MSDNIAQRIEASLSLSVCNGWDRGFLESVMSQVSRGRKLSVRQKEMLEQVLSRNTEEQQKVHEGWAQTYQDQYSDSGRILATYYSRTSYYRDMSACILNGEVPERKSFLRMFENKYAKRYCPSTQQLQSLRGVLLLRHALTLIMQQRTLAILPTTGFNTLHVARFSQTSVSVVRLSLMLMITSTRQQREPSVTRFSLSVPFIRSLLKSGTSKSKESKTGTLLTMWSRKNKNSKLVIWLSERMTSWTTFTTSQYIQMKYPILPRMLVSSPALIISPIISESGSMLSCVPMASPDIFSLMRSQSYKNS